MLRLEPIVQTALAIDAGLRHLSRLRSEMVDQIADQKRRVLGVLDQVFPESGEHLTERELEMLRLVARGASNREIAQKLVITEGTVKSHLNHVLRKLDARNRTEAVARARGLGVLDI